MDTTLDILFHLTANLLILWIGFNLGVIFCQRKATKQMKKLNDLYMNDLQKVLKGWNKAVEPKTIKKDPSDGSPETSNP